MAVSLRRKDEIKVPLSHKEMVAVEKAASSLGVSLAEFFRVYVMRVQPVHPKSDCFVQKGLEKGRLYLEPSPQTG